MTAQDAFGACDVRNRNQQSEIDQLHSQVQLLQQQNTDLTNKQHVGLAGNRNNGGAQQAQPDTLSISDEQRQSVLAGLQAKLARGEDLSQQEKYAYQMLTKNTAGVNKGVDQFPKQQALPRDTQDGGQVHIQRKQEHVDDPIINKVKQLPPPQPKEQAFGNRHPAPAERNSDQEEVKDLANKEEDMRDQPGDDFEGGADGDKDNERLPEDFEEENVQDGNRGDEDEPLPKPVNNGQEEGDEDEDDKRDEDYGDLHVSMNYQVIVNVVVVLLVVACFVCCDTWCM